MSHAYRACISHSKQHRAWGKRIHIWLETCRVPVGSAVERRLADRLGKRFRDEEELPVAANIAETGEGRSEGLRRLAGAEGT